MKTTRTKRLGPRVVGVRAAKAQLSRLLQDVQDGGEWTITNRGKPIARLVPIGHGALSVGERIHRLEENGIIEPARAGRFPLPPPLPLKTGFAQKICWTKIAIPAREADHRSTQRIGTHPLFGRRSFAMRTVGVPLNTRAAKASILKHRERVLPPGLLHSTAGRTRRGPPADAATAVGARWTLANAADVSEPGQALPCRPRGSRAQQRARREISGLPRDAGEGAVRIRRQIEKQHRTSEFVYQDAGSRPNVACRVAEKMSPAAGAGPRSAASTIVAAGRPLASA